MTPLDVQRREMAESLAENLDAACGDECRHKSHYEVAVRIWEDMERKAQAGYRRQSLKVVK